MSEAMFAELSFKTKIRKLTKQACRSISKNKVIIVCFVGCGITKLYAILFSTFWLLFISSFIGTEIANADQAKTIYSNVMMVSVVLGVLLVPIVGRLADTIDPRCILPTSFLSRAMAVVMFCYIKSPATLYSYFVSVLLVLGTVLENVTVDVILLRNADK